MRHGCVAKPRMARQHKHYDDVFRGTFPWGVVSTVPESKKHHQHGIQAECERILGLPETLHQQTWCINQMIDV